MTENISFAVYFMKKSRLFNISASEEENVYAKFSRVNPLLSRLAAVLQKQLEEDLKAGDIPTAMNRLPESSSKTAYKDGLLIQNSLAALCDGVRAVIEILTPKPVSTLPEVATLDSGITRFTKDGENRAAVFGETSVHTCTYYLHPYVVLLL